MGRQITAVLTVLIAGSLLAAVIRQREARATARERAVQREKIAETRERLARFGKNTLSPTDAWGGVVHVVDTDGWRTFTSAGADQIFGTDDDLTARWHAVGEACALLAAVRRQRCMFEMIDRQCAHDLNAPVLFEIDGVPVIDNAGTCNQLAVTNRIEVGVPTLEVNLSPTAQGTFKYMSALVTRSSNGSNGMLLCGQCVDELIHLPDGGWEPAHGDTASDL